MKATTLLLAAMAVLSGSQAYVLRLFEHRDYKGDLIGNWENTFNHGTNCHNVKKGRENEVSSFIWTATPLCTAKFMSKRDCHGDMLGRSTGGWHKKSLSPEANDKIDSVEVTCL
ncbi:hypothetical protein BGZ73_002248 [Actinomortierella ambigua]|nr:hypothetical protein BGZ73_002248 [Actinomortierella ambigua]